jgi:signal peptidase
MYIQHPPGLYIAIAAGAILLILVFLPDLFEKDEKKNKNSPDNGNTTQG